MDSSQKEKEKEREERMVEKQAKKRFTLNYANDRIDFDTFVDAFKELYRRLKEDLAKGNMTYQVMETFIWIEFRFADREYPMMFYPARDFACNIGLLNDGELVEDCKEPDDTLLIMAFSFSLRVGEFVAQAETVDRLASIESDFSELVDLSNLSLEEKARIKDDFKQRTDEMKGLQAEAETAIEQEAEQLRVTAIASREAA